MARTYKVRRYRYHSRRHRNPSGGNIVGLLLLGVGGYLLYKWMITPATVAVPVTQSTGQTVTTTAPPPTTNTVSTTPTVTQAPTGVDITASMYTALNATPGTLFNLDQWLWALQQVKNVTITPNQANTLVNLLSAQGIDRTTPIPLSTFTNLLSTAGLSGLGRVYVSGFSGLGMIGAGYNINAMRSGDASYYELASKWVM